ncbi:MAG: DUF87 domain-containing protein [archaeon]|nr:DUF87 domain-containing protein [archaeon]
MIKKTEEIGTVISTPDGPSPSSLDFVVYSGTIHRGMFVELDYKEGTLVALVTDVVKTNRYFERVESVKEFESSGTKLFEQFPTHEWEFLLAKTRPLGVYDKGMIKRSSFPPSPGAKVRVASKETLESFLGLDLEKGLLLGEIDHHDVSVKLNLSRLFQKHLAVLAMSGAGKSYTISVLLEELLIRKKEDGRLAVLLMDAHGEYRSFAEPVKGSEFKDFSSKTKFVKASEISIGVSKLSVGAIAAMVPSMSGPQRRDLGKVFIKLRNEMKDGLGPFDFNAVKSEIIKDAEMKEVTKQALIGWIVSLEQLNLFGKTDNPSINDLVRPGELTIIDLSDVVDMKKKQIIVSYFARKLFNERRNNRICPFTMIVEEAHQFCLSEDTEILTPTGWKNYLEINKGDLAFSYTNSGKLEPNSIERVLIKDYNGEMIKLYNEDSIDALVTPDHRVLCNTRTTGEERKWKWSDTKFVFAKDLPSGCRIPVFVLPESISECIIDDDLIKVIGWIVTDGTLHRFKDSYSYEISQSSSKQIIFQKMKKTIGARFPNSSLYTRTKKKRFIQNRELAASEENIFYLGKKYSDEINLWLQDNSNRIPRELLEQASEKQLKILFDSLVEGDGSIQTSKNGHDYVIFYVGHNIGLADDFQELCFRLGFSAIVKKVPQNGQTKVLVSFKRKFSFVKKIQKEHYVGKVWDITIKHGAFIARRNGKLFVTGNCPEGASKEAAISRSIIETIAREGRKFGASICLVSQRPINLSTTALSQCNTHLILRVTNPYDLKHIGETSEGLDSRSIDMITSLRTGEALLVGEAVNYPVFFKVRKRLSQPSMHEKSLEQASVEFEEIKEVSQKDIEDLL